MGGKDSANEFIKKVNPQNVSGVVKSALDLISNLKQSQGNPTMVDAVGASPLASMMSQVAADFAQPSIHDDKEARKKHLQEQIDALKKMLAELKALIPQTDDLIAQEKVIQEQIDELQKELDSIQ